MAPAAGLWVEIYLLFPAAYIQKAIDEFFDSINKPPPSIPGLTLQKKKSDRDFKESHR